MKLNVKERFILRRVFAPETTTLLESDLWDDIMDKVKITAKEANDIGMVQDGLNLAWDETKEKPLDLDLTDEQIKMLRKVVRKKDDAGAIPYNPDDKTAVELAKKILNGTKDK